MEKTSNQLQNIFSRGDVDQLSILIKSHTFEELKDLLVEPNYGEQKTLVHLAVMNSQDKIIMSLVKFLKKAHESGLSCESITNAQDRTGWTPLHICCSGHNYKLAKLLLSFDLTDASICSSDGSLALHYLVRTKDTSSVTIKAVKKIIDLMTQASRVCKTEFGLNVKTKNGETPIHLACFAGNEEIVKILIQKGADISKLNSKGESCLHYAVRSKNKELSQMLIDMGADPSISGRYGSVGEVAKVYIPSGLRTAGVPRGGFQFEDFSDELILYIFQFLKTPKLLLIVGHVCRLFRQISQDPSLWKTVSGQEKSQFCEKTKKLIEDKRVIASNPPDHYDYLLKMVIAGDYGTGKSSLLVRYADDVFSESFIATIGVDFKIKTMHIEDKIVKIIFYDTSGQEKFRRGCVSSYYRGALGVILVYDVTDQTSFINCSEWLLSIERYGFEDIVKLLVGNKCDLTSTRVTDYATGKEFADKHDLPYLETSAKDGTNVTLAFNNLIKGVFDQRREKDSKNPPIDPKTATSSPKPKKKGIINKLSQYFSS